MATTTPMSSADADAIIDAALLGPNAGKAIIGPAPDVTSDLAPQGQPYTPLDEQAPPPPEQTEDEKKLAQAQRDMLGEEAAAQLEKEQAEALQREQTLIGQAEKLLARSKQQAATWGDLIARVPTPGNLRLPLVLLILFFFILIQFNGNTRLQWLWLVITGNAYVTDTNQVNSQESPPSPQPSENTGHSGGGPGIIVSPDLVLPALLLPPKGSSGTYGEAY